MIIRCEEWAFTVPSVIEKENRLFLSVKNWKLVGRSLELMTFRRRFVVY